MSQKTKARVLFELQERCDSAEAALQTVRDDSRTDSANWSRLNGKIQGVRLVRSYIEDEIRATR